MDFALLAWTALGLSLAMAGAWAVQRATGESGWVDTIWSFAVGAAGIAIAAFADAPDAPFTRRIAVILIIGAWSIRLGLHIAARTRMGGEDPRYEALIKQWGPSFSSRLFLFLQIQALAAFILVLAVYLAVINSSQFPGILDIVAIIIALVAIVGEAVSDAQLAAFRKTPQAKTMVCETGLWRYSRHPNYFFEWLGWCAFPLLAIDLGGGSHWGWLALLAPLQMYWLLVHVSGIPPLEEHMLKSRGEAFRALQSRVNAFFPGPRHERS